MVLSDPVSQLSGVGEKLCQSFSAKNILTVEDLLFYLPRRYDDYGSALQIAKLRPGQVTVKAKLTHVSLHRARRGLSITEAIASDSSGSVHVVWFNQPYRKSSIRSDVEYYLSGEFKLSNRQFTIVNPSLEMASGKPLSGARIVPVYGESRHLSSWQVRKAEQTALSVSGQIPDFLPGYLIAALKLMPLADAMGQIHFPSSQALLAKAKRRFQFDELFPLLLASELNKLEREKESTLKVPFKLELAQEFVARLPFKLTADQRRVIWQIYQDMGKQLPMNRLVEGDVGSGKTVVAVMSAVMALASGFKVAFMAPTELLARQHFETIRALLKPLKMEHQLVLLTGSMKSVAKKKALNQANDLSNSFVVGTHSLLTSGVNWSNLALIVIDEQHRFGVDQRQQLQKQAGHVPHFLSITATPIPRSLALTIFNDLSLSRLAQLPAGRKPITTKLIYPSDTKSYFEILNKELHAGRQAYIVCPTIKESSNSGLKSAETVFDHYRGQFKKYTVEMVHGQMKSEQQNRVMENFAAGKIDILVATTVVEVGVDVANASVMAIFGPERFGLAQLHQLRGRVGRGDVESYCFLLLSDSLEPPSRLRQFATINDGFRLSELDLNLRGPGAVYGKLQHGKGFSELLTLDDPDLIKTVKDGVRLFIAKREKLLKYPLLAKRVESARQITYLN